MVVHEEEEKDMVKKKVNKLNPENIKKQTDFQFLCLFVINIKLINYIIFTIYLNGKLSENYFVHSMFYFDNMHNYLPSIIYK
jgi:hypothetical protein